MLSRVALPRLTSCVSAVALLVAFGCGSDSDDGDGAGGKAGSGGTPGTAGSTGVAGAVAGAAQAGAAQAGAAQAGAPQAGTAGAAQGGGSAGVTAGSTPGGAGQSSGGGPTTGGSAGAAGTGGTGGSGGAGGMSPQGGMSGGMGGKAGAGAGGTGGASGAAGSGGSTGFTLTTPAWMTQAGCSPTNKAPCGIFPRDTTQLNGGKNQSPELNWTAGPAGTQSYAVMLHDLSNIQQNAPYVHWVMWNIPGSVMQLPANLEKTAMPSIPAGSSQRSNNNNSPGYQGSGKCGNVYEFVVWALPTSTFAAPGGNQTAVATALKATNAPMATLRATSGPPECML